ncbi:hypothetical protein ES703_109675 [subsurface metagenome]
MKQIFYPFSHIFLTPPMHPEAERNVAENMHMRKKCIILENKAYIPYVRRKIGHIVVI